MSISPWVGAVCGVTAMVGWIVMWLLSRKENRLRRDLIGSLDRSNLEGARLVRAYFNGQTTSARVALLAWAERAERSEDL